MNRQPSRATIKPSSTTPSTCSVLHGEDAAKDVVRWLKQSAEQGNADAQYRLGLILYEGRLVPKDSVTGAHRVYLAADQNHVEALRLLKEMQIFIEAAEQAEARKRADAFKPAKESAAAPQKPAEILRGP